jgi:hypothetical protein
VAWNEVAGASRTPAMSRTRAHGDRCPRWRQSQCFHEGQARGTMPPCHTDACPCAVCKSPTCSQDVCPS